MTGNAVRWLMSLVHRTPPVNGARLTIIRHHRVYAAGERPLYRLGVSEAVLTDQLGLLGRARLVPLTVAEGLSRLASGSRGHWVSMSFDDGYADNVDRALPRLLEAGARATFYLTAGLIERRLAPWWDELAYLLERTRVSHVEWETAAGPTTFELPDRARRARALSAIAPTLRLATPARAAALAVLRERLGVEGAAPCELATWEACRALVQAGMEVGAHTLTHPHLSLLDRAAQREEIAGSIDQIEARLGVRPGGLAYPGGDHDAVTIEVCGSLGLEHAVTTRAGDNAPGVGRYLLRRRGWSEGACLGPGRRFSRRLARAEIDGAFDRLRGVEVTA